MDVSRAETLRGPDPKALRRRTFLLRAVVVGHDGAMARQYRFLGGRSGSTRTTRSPGRRSSRAELATGLAALLVLGVAVEHERCEVEAARGKGLLANRVWIDHMPTTSREFTASMVLIQHRKGRVGALSRASQWRARIEGMRWQRDGDRLRVHFPQDDVRSEVKVRVWRCEDEAPRPFELCLELSDGERTMKLYSREDWEVRVDAAGRAQALPGEVALPARIMDLPRRLPLAPGDVDLDASDARVDGAFPWAIFDDHAP